jgi:valyl-tRNA synthetase
VQDKWLLLQLNEAIEDCSQRALQHLLRRDLTLWYLPAGKALLPDALPENDTGLAQSLPENFLAVTDYVISQLLRLLHPALPELTNDLWHQLGFHHDMPARQGGEHISQAPKPKPLDEDELAYFGILPEDAKQATALHQTVRQGRRLGSKGKPMLLHCADPMAEHQQAQLCALLGAIFLKVQVSSDAPLPTMARTPVGWLSVLQ